MLPEHRKSSYYFPFVRNIPNQKYLAGLGRWRNTGDIQLKSFSYNHFLPFQSFWLHSYYIQNHIAIKRLTFSLKSICHSILYTGDKEDKR